MTPKEKAEQLLNRFWFDTTLDELEQAKDCALIAVDEILETTKHELWAYSADGTESILDSIQYDDYWTEVKQEIEKL